MTYLGVIVLVPVLFWALSGGCGLLMERLAGARLPSLLLMPLGFGVLVVVSQLTTWWRVTAAATPIILVLLAVGGLWFGRGAIARRWRERTSGWWWVVLIGPLSFLIAAAAPIVAGRVTFTGYLLDTTAAIQLAGGESLLHHAHDFPAGSSAYTSTLHAYFGSGYPSGGQGVLASIGWLCGISLLWLYNVFQALELSLVALVLAFLAAVAGLKRPFAALAGVIASVPALVYAYVLMGSIKEITALPLILLMGALAVHARRLAVQCGLRAVLLFAVAGGAALGAIGIAASPWVGAFAVVGLLTAIPPIRMVRVRALVAAGATLAIATVLAGLPTVAPLSKSVGLAEGVSNANAAARSDPGNLLRPLKFLQTFGVWLGESHRVEPRYLNQTYILIGIVGVCLALGLIWLVRRGRWNVLCFVGLSVAVWAYLHSRGTEWTDAKLLVILSPVVVFVAMLGALGLLQKARLEGLVLSVAVVVGVLVSDALLYHGTNLAPTARYEELSYIGERFAGDGPTLAPDFDEYDLYALRAMEVSGPGFAYGNAFSFVKGTGALYGASYDLDDLQLSSVEQYKTIVMLRSPNASRPPGNYVLAYRGPYYTVWSRSGPPPAVHVGLDSPTLGPVAKPSCRLVRSLARQAQSQRAELQFTARAGNSYVDLADLAYSTTVGFNGTSLSFTFPARVEGSFSVPSTGKYVMWFEGALDRPMHVFIDGRQVGDPSQQSGDDGNMIYVATLHLTTGRHKLKLLRYGASLAPNQIGSAFLDEIIFEPASAEYENVQRVAPSAWRSLCGRTLDWLEVT